MGLWDLADAVGRCGRSYANLGCRIGGEVFYREIVCRFPLCERCGAEDSEAESRKKAKALEKFDRVEGVWKLVLTLPTPVRDLLFRMDPDDARRDLVHRKTMSKLRRAAADFGKEVFGVEGLEVALHPIGDKGGFNPHFEVLAPFFQGEWADPMTCPLVREWIASLSHRWGLLLRTRLAVDLPRSVQVHASFADKPERIVHKVKYAVDHHWSRKPDYIKRKALRFAAALRGHRLSRGYGLLDDKHWRGYVESKPYAHPEMVLEAEDRAKESKLSLRDGCPCHGCRLRFKGISDERDIRKEELREIKPGVWVDRVHALLIEAHLEGGEA